MSRNLALHKILWFLISLVVMENKNIYFWNAFSKVLPTCFYFVVYSLTSFSISFDHHPQWVELFGPNVREQGPSLRPTPSAGRGPPNSGPSTTLKEMVTSRQTQFWLVTFLSLLNPTHFLLSWHSCKQNMIVTCSCFQSWVVLHTWSSVPLYWLSTDLN